MFPSTGPAAWAVLLGDRQITEELGFPQGFGALGVFGSRVHGLGGFQG